MKYGLSGEFAKIEVKHADGSSTVLEPFPNLITNYGLDALGVAAASAVQTTCIASSNSATPTETESSALNVLGSTSSRTQTISNSGGDPEWYYQNELVYTFAQGAVVGNVSKLYIGASTTQCFSVALVKDSGGDPTTITLTATDQLFVTWRFRKYISITPVTGTATFDFNGVPTDVAFEIQPAFLGNTGGFYYFSPSQGIGSLGNTGSVFETDVLGSVTSQPAGTSQSALASQPAYVNGNYYRDALYSLTTSDGNFPTGIGSMSFANVGSNNGFQIKFTPKLPKTADSTLTIPIRVSWGRL